MSEREKKKVRWRAEGERVGEQEERVIQSGKEQAERSEEQIGACKSDVEYVHAWYTECPYGSYTQKVIRYTLYTLHTHTHTHTCKHPHSLT
jgi:hypothetical protein